MTEVLKRQCSKSKKGYNQVKGVFFFFSNQTLYIFSWNTSSSHSSFLSQQHISISEVKVDKVQVVSAEEGTTFDVCLDQDEKKFIQSVTRYDPGGFVSESNTLISRHQSHVSVLVWWLGLICRCEVSLCCKAGSSSDWRSYKPLPGQVQPLHPSYCSLLCLPITSFSASYPWRTFSTALNGSTELI